MPQLLNAASQRRSVGAAAQASVSQASLAMAGARPAKERPGEVLEDRGDQGLRTVSSTLIGIVASMMSA